MKKILCGILTVLMLMSFSVGASSYVDVPETAESIEVLNDLGIMKGTGDNQFEPNAYLTRAEGATLIIRLLGLEDAAIAATGTGTDFIDVPRDHWANGYVTIATSTGIIAGMGDGTFAPEEQMTFAQFTKMLVAALGYNPQAEENGEWPNNYLVTATDIKLTKGFSLKANDPIKRSDIAELAYAALTIPKMEKNGVGINAVYQPGDTLILDDLGIQKLYGTVDSINEVDKTAVLNIVKQGLAIDGKYKEIYIFSEDATYESEGAINCDNFITYLKNAENVPLVFYVDITKEDYTLVSVTEKKNIETITFLNKDVVVDDNKVYYYEVTEEKSFKFEGDFNIDENADVITVKDLDSNGKFDTITTIKYDYCVVSDIEIKKSGKYIFNNEIGDNFEYDPEDDRKVVTFIHNDKEINADDIEINQVLNIIEDETSVTVYITDTIIVDTVRYVDGDIVKMQSDSEYYKTSNITLTSGTEATFYLNILNEIVYVSDEIAVSAYEYGYATNLILSGKSNKYTGGTIRILNTNGNWVTYDLRNRFVYNNNTVTINSDIENLGDATIADAREPEWAINSLIAFKTDSTGAVKEILTTPVDNSLVYHKDTVERIVNINKDETTFGNYIINNKTVVYNVNGTEEKDISVTNISVFKDGNPYSAQLVNIGNKTDIVGIMVGTFVAEVNPESNMFIVSKVLNEIIDDVETKTIIGYQAGEEVTYFINMEGEVYNNEQPINAGTIMLLTSNNNYITAYSVIGAIVEDNFSNESFPVFEDGAFIKGSVEDIKDSTSKFSFEDNDDAIFYSAKKAVITLYDATEREGKELSEGSVSDIEVGTYVIARIDEDDNVLDMIVIYNEN